MHTGSGLNGLHVLGVHLLLLQTQRNKQQSQRATRSTMRLARMQRARRAAGQECNSQQDCNQRQGDSRRNGIRNSTCLMLSCIFFTCASKSAICIHLPSQHWFAAKRQTEPQAEADTNGRCSKLNPHSTKRESGDSAAKQTAAENEQPQRSHKAAKTRLVLVLGRHFHVLAVQFGEGGLLFAQLPLELLAQFRCTQTTNKGETQAAGENGSDVEPDEPAQQAHNHQPEIATRAGPTETASCAHITINTTAQRTDREQKTSASAARKRTRDAYRSPCEQRPRRRARPSRAAAPPAPRTPALLG